MGYTTDFYGSVDFSRALTAKQRADFDVIHEERHEERTHPGYYCQWETNGESLYWDGGEKFYYYVEWLEWLIEHFFKPKGIVLNGAIEWDGEERGDIGIIIVTYNIVEVKNGHITY